MEILKKINIPRTAARIVLLLIIMAFFLPFVSVSCEFSGQHEEIALNGRDFFMGMNFGEQYIDGSPYAVIYIILPLIAFIKSFFKFRSRLFARTSEIFDIIVPLADLFLAFILINYIKLKIDSVIESYGSVFSLIASGLKIETTADIGFYLYIIFNAVFLVYAVSVFIINSKRSAAEEIQEIP